MTLDHEKLKKDMYSKVLENGSSQMRESKKIGVSPTVFYSVNNYCDIHISTYLKLVEWLGKDVGEYLTK